ncbi:hypothetical protein [Photobacterium satsumensis]|uniref:hypothetical protein n=1 Tax=Photobacterium satsumensis TaxID=2910239 RepID=UPI003D11A485
MHLAIVFGIVALLLTWWLAEVVYVNNTKVRLFTWATVFTPILLLFSGNTGAALISALFWFLYVLISGIYEIDSEKSEWDLLKPICDDCGKVYANRKHISVSNWKMMTYINSRKKVLVCYQCHVRNY